MQRSNNMLQVCHVRRDQRLIVCKKLYAEMSA